MLVITSSSFAERFNVVFINPGHPQGDATGAFWSNVSRFMEAAAEDVDIELVTFFAKRNHLLMKELAVKAVRLKPDYVIVVNEKGAGVQVAEILVRHNIPVFALLNRFTDVELSHWTNEQRTLIIGSLIPDNVAAGKNLMLDILKIHQSKYGNSNSNQVLALHGDYRSAAALERKIGLQQALEMNKQLVLIDSPVVNWSAERSYQLVKGLLQRQRIDMIWAANDPIAFGAKKAVVEAELDHHVSIGGINWDEPKDVVIDVSYGGHVALGAKALTMLSDFHHNYLKPCHMIVRIDIFKSSLVNDVKTFVHNSSSAAIRRFDFSLFSNKSQQPKAFDIRSFIDSDFYQAATPLSECYD